MPIEVPEDIARSLDQLNDAVDQLREGRVDEETVRRIVGEMQAQYRAIDNPDGYRPQDYAPGAGIRSDNVLERLEQYHTRAAAGVASMIRRPEDAVSAFQRSADVVLLLDTIMSRDGRVDYDVRQSNYYQQEFLPAARAIDTQTTGEGAEWVPTALSGELVRRISLQLRVGALFRVIQQPTPTYRLPAVGVSRLRTGSHAEQTADTGQTKFRAVTPRTRDIVLRAVKIAARALVSKEAEEDEVVPVLEWVLDEMLEALAADLEDMLINSVVGTHLDADVTDADDPRRLWDGLRKLTPRGARQDGGGDALTTADLLNNIRVMGRYGVHGMQTGKLVHLVSIGGFISLLGAPEVLTVDRFGPRATILTGQLASVHGVPLIVSEFVRSDLNASGVYDGTTRTRTQALTVHTGAYLQGERRGVTTQYLRELYAESDQDAVIASWRRSFVPLYAGETTSAETYNVQS